ncbi:MAG TPA: LamG domain-containing protein [Solirubrobacteraceae bacterium]|nr:LamG domain-containing protein [Solirubrobacteraceae bacterium]
MRALLATWVATLVGALAVAAPASAQSVKLAGTDTIGLPGSNATPGVAEVYKTTATASGSATSISLYIDEASTADRLVLGLYADQSGQPTDLLASGSLSNPAPGDWSTVTVSATPVTEGRAYWIALLNPADSAGTLRWRDRAGGSGGDEQGSAATDLIALPSEWETGPIYGDGPLTAYVSGTTTPTGPPSLGLVGAWGFDETSGSTAGDASGHGNAGLISGASRRTGRYGNGLRFDGVDDWVTVDDDATLDLSTGMTLEAWVRPETLGSLWRTVLIKEQDSQLAYALYANNDAGVPSGHVFTVGDQGLGGPQPLPVNQWSHLATTWDGSTLRLYVNGNEVSSTPLAGQAVESSGPLRIGGNAIWPEWFQGSIDEVRMYDRALTAAQIAADRDTRIGRGSGNPPQGHENSWLKRLIRYVIYRFKKHHGHWFDRDRGSHWLGYDGKPRWHDRADAYRWLSEAFRGWGR